MPPWPSLLHRGPPATSSGSPKTKVRSDRNPSTHSPAYESHPPDPPLLGVPVLASNDLIVASPPKHKPQHGRSHSNPFTSLFANGKKTEKVLDAEMRDDVVDSFDQQLASSSRPSTSNQTIVNATESAENHDKQLVVGKCSTCDTALKWPRQVDSFRCQICLMINDLKPSISPLGEVLLGSGTGGTTSKKCELVVSNQAINTHVQTRSAAFN